MYTNYNNYYFNTIGTDSKSFVVLYNYFSLDVYYFQTWHNLTLRIRRGLEGEGERRPLNNKPNTLRGARGSFFWVEKNMYEKQKQKILTRPLADERLYYSA